MEFWIEKKHCTGCGACQNICPKNAISLVEDDCGFKYPKIDKELCIDCGLCKKNCPIISNKKNINDILYAFAGWSKDSKTRYESTSGGMFTEFAKSVIKKGGYVVGAGYSDDNMVAHKIVHNEEELSDLRQSKYLQSDINYIFVEIKKLLKDNKQIVFCGSPCQVAGLYNYLGKDFDNLLTIEFICRGMNSPKAYRAWIREIENKENKKIQRVWFKYKINGWNSSPKCTRVDFSDKSTKIYNDKKNLYMRGYLESNLYIRPCCGICEFNGIHRNSDIVLGDFWGIDKSLDDDKGTSLILINTKKGQKAFDEIVDNIEYSERSIDEVYNGNVCFTNSVEINSNSTMFLNKVNEFNFSKLVKKYNMIFKFKIFFIKIKRKISKIFN